MRPFDLDPLFAPVRSLDGVGPKLADALARLTGRENADETRVIDLLFHLPTGVIDRSRRPEIAFAPQGSIVTIKARVDRHQTPPPARRNAPYRVFLHDETGELALTFFRAKPAWMEKRLPVGEEVIVSGKIDWFNGQPSMVHPDRIFSAAEADTMAMIEPVYPLSDGVSPRILQKLIDAALSRLPDLPEWLDAGVAARHDFPDFSKALRAAHGPRDSAATEPQNPARRRLAYDEFLAGQLSLALVRRRIRKARGRSIIASGQLQQPIRNGLPFSLTRAQERAIADIITDLGRSERMLRLLQGDVGSGKTLVALMAMAAAAEAGSQSVMMAPTEILARQHAATLQRMAQPAGLDVTLLTGRMKSREREDALARIASGETALIVGTHALFQDTVVYHDLALAVVDEQHRFGVHQRLRLTSKGQAPHMLVMTATPIPRTLVLSLFGDMDVSKLTEKPAGRTPIKTVAIPSERIGDIVARLGAAIRSGRKAYWICPLVEDSEHVDTVSTETRAAMLAAEFDRQTVGLIHGRMASADKEAAMAGFASGPTRILVATTVVEVGVDVSDASIIVIEHAERFGLSQLHQLRGRVGRGSENSTCILLYKGPLAQTAKARLQAMRESDDGFFLAEQDLKLRGEGELLGTRQSGTPGFRLASLEAHGDLLEMARNDARYVLETDPDLASPRGQALRRLLYLMRRDEAIRFLNAG